MFPNVKTCNMQCILTLKHANAVYPNVKTCNMLCFLTFKNAICNVSQSYNTRYVQPPLMCSTSQHKPTLCYVVNLQYTVATEQLGLQMANSTQRPQNAGRNNQTEQRRIRKQNQTKHQKRKTNE